MPVPPPCVIQGQVILCPSRGRCGTVSVSNCQPVSLLVIILVAGDAAVRKDTGKFSSLRDGLLKHGS